MTTAEMPVLEPADSSHFITIDDSRVHYNLVGSAASRVPVVFTHGGGPGSTSWNNFLYNAAALSERYTCYFSTIFRALEFPNCVPVRGPVFSWYANQLLKFLSLY